MRINVTWMAWVGVVVGCAAAADNPSAVTGNPIGARDDGGAAGGSSNGSSATAGTNGALNGGASNGGTSSGASVGASAGQGDGGQNGATAGGSTSGSSLDPDDVPRGPGVETGGCEVQSARACYPFDPSTWQVGVCKQGAQECAGGEFSEWTECKAALGPSKERCNGKDDNCDGDVDEGLLNVCGECAPDPVETCNGKDDDCDGDVDEGLLNVCGECAPDPVETCNGKDDDCDGKTDEGLLNVCGKCGADPVETCNDVDDDCDGTIDEGCACDAVTTGSGADVTITPADIVLIVDNSASMNDETGAIQTQLQAFANRLASGGLDARLILLTTRGTDAREICVAPPLGGPACADNPAQDFFHIDESISSHLGLHDFEDRYEDWRALLRSGATFHTVLVSDDNEFWTAAEFLNRYATWAPAPPKLTYHAIVSTQLCANAASIGQNHIDLANQTGGTVHNLCDQRIDLALNGIADGIVKANVDCSWPLPSAPAGGVLDTARTSVAVTTGAVTTQLQRAANATACGAAAGFYVSGDRVSLCHASCDAIQGDADVDVRVSIECVIGGT